MRPQDVYREPVEHDVESETEGQRFGLVKAIPQHWCQPPGLILRFLLRIIFRPIRWRSLWRCEDCGQVWQWRMPDYRSPDDGDPSNAILRQWVKTEDKVWIEAGGKL